MVIKEMTIQEFIGYLSEFDWRERRRRCINYVTKNAISDLIVEMGLNRMTPENAALLACESKCVQRLVMTQLSI